MYWEQVYLRKSEQEAAKAVEERLGKLVEIVLRRGWMGLEGELS